MSKPDMGFIFHIKNQWNILATGNYYVNSQNFRNSMLLYPPRILNEHWCIFSCLQIPPRENWFQYVRRVYATGINFPCMSTLHLTNIYRTSVLAPVLQACSLYDDLRVLNQRNWAFAINSDFIIPISLQPYVVDPRYFKLCLL